MLSSHVATDGGTTTWRTSRSPPRAAGPSTTGLGTGPVSYEDSISPEHYELERDAIFRKTWLNVGRVEQLPRTGSYFTKELDAARTSVVVVRRHDGEVRAFHNICRHRGNKLVWNDYPGEETSGTCRQFTCKYHGWRYDLEGDLTFVQQEAEFFDLDKADYGLVPVQVEVWEGFIFVNLDPENTTPLRDYLGELGAGIEGYPFGEMTQVYKYRAEVGSNWKLFIDAFAEFYHAPVLHAKQAVAEESRKLQGFGFEALAYDIDGPHGMVSSWGGMAPPKDLNMVKPIERVLRSGLFGPWDRPDIGLDELPPGLNPARHHGLGRATRSCSSRTSCCWCGSRTGTSRTTTGRRPTTRHIFEGTLYFVPPKNAYERLAQELAAVTFKEYAPPGRQHPRGHADDARVAGGHRVPAQRPGDPAAPPAHDRPRLRAPSTSSEQSTTPVRISAAS